MTNKIKTHYKGEILLTYALLAITIAALAMFSDNLITHYSAVYHSFNLIGFAKYGLFLAVVYYLVYGNIVYHLTRIGHFKRLAKHLPLSHSDLDTLHTASYIPTVSILMPAYKENIEVIQQTVLSAALQRYPHKNVVLLIDNPPNPKSSDDIELLAGTKKMITDLNNEFAANADYYKKEWASFKARASEIDIPKEQNHLSSLYATVLDWYVQLQKAMPPRSHADELFSKEVIQNSIDHLKQRQSELKKMKTTKAFLQEYWYLATIFNATISSFERKKYANLSQEANKAANLNSYIGLMGLKFIEVVRNNKTYIQEALPTEVGYEIPSTDYVLTLDADSILLPNYASKLISFMEKPENHKIAVVQTPYNAVPNPSNILERVAGATTDIQYLIHQGFTHYNASFWVGANALIRKQALDDIKFTEHEENTLIYKFIQDRTVIEDTESTIDLVEKGWSLHNYPERLAYSATPSDFGSLLIQRRRWANGGLIIFPKLFRYAMKSRQIKFSEFFIRTHYLTSVGLVSFGVLFMLLVPMRDSFMDIWLPLTAVPYYFLYGRDLSRIGYKWSDLLRVYAFNLMLIPINVGGVLKSIEQGITGKKIPFGRTPKVADRTAAPVLYLFAEYMLFGYLLFGFISDILAQRYLHAGFSLFNGLFFAYVLHSFIGWKASGEDFKNWLIKDAA